VQDRRRTLGQNRGIGESEEAGLEDDAAKLVGEDRPCLIRRERHWNAFAQVNRIERWRLQDLIEPERIERPAHGVDREASRLAASTVRDRHLEDVVRHENMGNRTQTPAPTPPDPAAIVPRERLQGIGFADAGVQHSGNRRRRYLK